MVRIAQFTDVLLTAAQSLSAQLFWPHGVPEWRQRLSLGNGVVALQNGRVAGTTLWWPHDAAATLGMVIVDQTHRGQGIAARLVLSALESIGNLPVVLTATDMARGGYARLGFEQTGMVDTCRGVPKGSLGQDARIAEVPCDAIMGLDAAARGWDRRLLLRSFAAEGAICWGLRERGDLVAYAMDRAMGPGRVIGPLVAPDVDTAEALVRHCLAAHPGVQLRIDSDPVLGLSDRLPALGLAKASWGTVMVRGELPLCPDGAPTVFGLASQAFS